MEFQVQVDVQVQVNVKKKQITYEWILKYTEVCKTTKKNLQNYAKQSKAIQNYKQNIQK